MAVTKISNSGIKTGVLKYDSMLAGNAAYDPAATWLIQRIAGTGSSGTITFSNIPQTYQHLQVRMMTRRTTAASDSSGMRTRMNANTSNYTYHGLYGTGSTVAAFGGGTGVYNAMPSPETIGNSAAANILSVCIMDIHDYASTTKNKTIRTFEGYDANGSGIVMLQSSVWIDTTAVTSIEIATNNPASIYWTSNSTFALYGMIGA